MCNCTSGNDDPGCLALLATASPSLRLRYDPQVRLRRLPALRIDGLGLVVGDRTGDDDVLALFPVGGCRDAMLRGHLYRVDRAQDFLEVAACGHGIDRH